MKAGKAERKLVENINELQEKYTTILEYVIDTLAYVSKEIPKEISEEISEENKNLCSMLECLKCLEFHIKGEDIIYEIDDQLINSKEIMYILCERRRKMECIIKKISKISCLGSDIEEDLLEVIQEYVES